MNLENLWTVYLSCPAFPGKVKTSTLEANTLQDAKELALSLYPGYSIYEFC